MKAIVLTCDKYAPFAAHMVAAYRRIWPDHPFRFRVGYQDAMPEIEDESVHPVQTPAPIRDTVLGLIEDLPNEEWVYWCIDDKYPIELDLDVARRTHEWVVSMDDPEVAGVSIARARRLTLAKHLRPDRWLRGPGGERFLRRRSYRQFWLHQYFRVGVLRHLFETLPGGHFPAHILDDIVMFQRRLPSTQRLYVREHNAMTLGESTEKGVVTQNCAESFDACGLALPSEFEVGAATTTIGSMGETGESPRTPSGMAKWAWAVARGRM